MQVKLNLPAIKCLSLWSWLGRDIPAEFKCGDAVFVRVSRPNIGKARDITISNIRMKDPYARGSRYSGCRVVLVELVR